jgi:hypothetical protein
MANNVSYQHVQASASALWTVTHNLNNYPIVDVMVDNDGVLTKIIPKNIRVINLNTCQIEFSSPRTGQARLV